MKGKYEFLKILKSAKITPVYKKDFRNDETNHVPVSVLSSLSKICEKCMVNQINMLFNVNAGLVKL